MAESVQTIERGIRPTAQGGWAAVRRLTMADGRVVFRLIEDFSGKGAKGNAIWAARSNREFT